MSPWTSRYGAAALCCLPLLFAACHGEERKIGTSTRSFPLDSVVKEDRPRFEIDRAEPWHLMLGRGSGLHGLETIRVESNGKVILRRFHMEKRQGTWERMFETKQLTLPDDSIKDLLKSVEKNGLMDMHRTYSAGGNDGEQWIVMVRQGEQLKSVYCDNHFPEPIVELSKELDELLKKHGIDGAEWVAETTEKPREHEQELWDSLR